MAIDTMRLMPNYRWKPIQFADKIHAWVLGEMRATDTDFSHDPYEDLT